MVDAVFATGTVYAEGADSGLPNTCWSRDLFVQCNATGETDFMYHGKRTYGEHAVEGMLHMVLPGPYAMLWA